MLIECNNSRYEWIDEWAIMPSSESADAGWAHSGLTITKSGDIVTCHSGDPTILLFDSEGKLKTSWTGDFVDGHGITAVTEGESEYLWIADNGSKRIQKHRYSSAPGDEHRSGKVFKTSLQGKTLLTLEQPPINAYQTSRYAPTSIAVNEHQYGGNGDIWVADGYGASYVHRFNEKGIYLSSISGEEGAGRFNCPHGIFIDRRAPDPELYIADRSNSRVQVYTLEGEFKRSFGENFLTTPSAFATYGDQMIIAELRARLAIVDMTNELICYLGDNEEVCETEGWPNVSDEDGHISRTNSLHPGKFNSPHGMACDSDGNIYVSEWLIGGRITKLIKS